MPRQLDIAARDITAEAEAARRKQRRRLKWQYFAIGVAVMGSLIYFALPTQEPVRYYNPETGHIQDEPL